MMTVVADQEILDKFRSGDRNGAFQQLVEIHGKAMYNIALFTLDDEILAQDATQDAFIRIYRGLGKFKGTAKLSTWMYRIVKNVCYDYHRKQRPAGLDEEFDAEALVDTAGVDPGATYQSGWQHAQLRRAVGQLPPKQRLAVTLHYFQELTYEEVAAVMNMPLGTIKSYLHRAKAALAQTLGPEERSST
ncbi:MAG: RNA polymerase sigma factor [Fidelibacterota bacterium]|nr:MAG: RNA polymerase sigma factor [Candidatus Neomarinimicrobiota bacterium]